MLLNLRNETKSLSKISKLVKKAKSIIKRIIDRYGINKSVENKTKTGRISILTERNKQFVVQKIKKNPKVIAQKLTKDIEKYQALVVSSETVRQAQREKKFLSRNPRKKFFASKVNKVKKLRFVKKYKTESVGVDIVGFS